MPSPHHLLGLEDLDDLAVAVAALVDVDRRMSQRLSATPNAPTHARALGDLLALAAAIARELGVDDLPTSGRAEELKGVHVDLARRLIERVTKSGRLVIETSGEA